MDKLIFHNNLSHIDHHNVKMLNLNRRKVTTKLAIGESFTILNYDIDTTI